MRHDIQRYLPSVLRALFSILVIQASATPSSGRAEEPFRIGVQTHFSQGWNPALLRRFDGLAIRSFRDEASWAAVETTPGQYDFAPVARYLSAAAAQGYEPLIVFAGANPLYDDGHTPFTNSGRRAMADYALALIRAFPDALRRIEIGNEFNSPSFVSGPFAEDPARHLALLLKDMHGAIKTHAPETEIVCAGAHSVAVGFFRSLFEHGALDACDAVSLHPYRMFPEQLDHELDRLKDLMRKFGGEKPIYITEFGKWFPDPAEAPAFMIKMAAIMADAGVAEAYWYALVDEPWWPNMGLLDAAGQEKPAAKAFRFLQTVLLPIGRPVSRSDSSLDHLYEFGSSGRAFVAWGAPGRLEVEGEARFYNASGDEIDDVSRISETPVVILGEGLKPVIRRHQAHYDSFHQFNEAPWSYHAGAEGEEHVDLEMVDGNWTSFIGNRFLKPLAMSEWQVSAVVFEGKPYHAIERFTAPETNMYEVSAWWRVREMEADGANLVISRNGKPFAEALLGKETFEFGPRPMMLDKGDVLEFAVGPNKEPGGDLVQRRITITAPCLAETC